MLNEIFKMFYRLKAFPCAIKTELKKFLHRKIYINLQRASLFSMVNMNFYTEERYYVTIKNL